MGPEVLLAVSVASSVAGSVMQGQGQKGQARFERAQLEEQRIMSDIGAKQDEVERRRRLKSTLAAQQAAAAANNRRVGSDISLNKIQGETTRRAMDDIATIRLMGLSSSRQYGLGIGQANAKSKSASRGMLFGVGKSLLTGGMKAYDAGMFSSGNSNITHGAIGSPNQSAHGIYDSTSAF